VANSIEFCAIRESIAGMACGQATY